MAENEDYLAYDMVGKEEYEEGVPFFIMNLLPHNSKFNKFLGKADISFVDYYLNDLVRLHFVKKEDTLNEALHRLSDLRKKSHQRKTDSKLCNI